MVGIARLGGEAHFIGKCGDDELGRLLHDSLKKQHVTPNLIRSNRSTGKVLSIITADAQRSMLTCLGASAETCPDDIPADSFNQAALVHLEGYLLFNRELITSVMAKAKAAGALVSLDLASYTVVKESREILTDLIERYVDILIANEDEALAYTGISDEILSVQAMAEHVDLAVLKTGPRGSLIACGDEVIQIAAKTNGRVVDTTGAGDLWASGFLYGLVCGMSLDQCGELGSICGFEVCQIVGATIPDDRWVVIHLSLEEKWRRKNG
jgi:sugar/nucleoside kinase (ribokinase family)